MTDVIVVELVDLAIEIEPIGDAFADIELLDTTATVEIIPVGYEGPTGPPGPVGGYTHTQSVAAATWTIAHNLGYRPTVMAFTTGGVAMLGTVTHLSDTVCQVAFNTAIAGTARLA